ncbi:hypothetical protein HPP92_021407 [Vanilla planifolia]|uniref:Phytocyanin domain-containing protein n=1 Tax=Vanilla planifolia TaxID=51239 RepID=A0A835Q2G8_VANPL|nr:hypothetical protein HPP92_021779 [Vanilla planifolia]KAG0462931.1 hypothetical protein HPP92_021407 [Vanilla planifolia]
MASSLASVPFFVLLLATTSVLLAAGHQYKVGGDDGWLTPPDDDPDYYAAWASNIRFQVGDSIVFVYKNDSVIRVEKRGFYHCNESSDGSASKDGSTVFLLDKPGLHYFVSGVLEHCKKGQRIAIDVMASRTPPYHGAPGPSPTASGAGGGVPVPRALAVSMAAALAAALAALFFLKLEAGT